MKIAVLVSLLFILASCSNEASIGQKKTTSKGVTAAAVDESQWLRDNTAPPNGGWNPVFSPDGGKIAFLSSTLHTPTDLWVIGADGSGARRLTTRGVQNFQWSEDGKSIRIKTVRKGYEEVLAIGLDGSRETRIAGLPPGSSFPNYSPDGTLFAITVPGEKNVRDLWIGTADGKRLEAVTEKIGVRSIFWHPDSSSIFYEAGKTYGVGIWQINLKTMESSSLVSNYIGPPVYSEKVQRVAYAFPTNPSEYDVRTMQLDGAEHGKCAAPRLIDRQITWDASGTGVYYLGQDIEKITASTAKSGADPTRKEEDGPPLHNQEEKTSQRVGVTALWRLDLESCVETRVSPAELHLTGFTLSPVSGETVLAGVLQNSYNTELFSLDQGAGPLKQLVGSRASSWLATPSVDSSKIAFFTNRDFMDSLKVATLEGEEITAYPGIAQEGDTRVFWLPRSDGLLIYSSRGLVAFNDKGPITFPTRNDHRAAFLGIDVSIQEDKVLLNSVPRYGETPGLYMLEAVDNVFVQTDLRFPSVTGEFAADLYAQPRWSLDGSQIAFTDRSDVWTMKADGTGRKWLTNYLETNKDAKNTPMLVSYPIWSSRGEMLAYTLTVYEEKIIHRQLWVMNADGSNSRLLYSQQLDSQFQVYLPEYTSLPFFDYDDTKIVFTAPHGGVPNLYSVTLADGKLTRLTEEGAIFPALLPEDDVIIYTSLAGNTEQLMTMNSDGSGKEPFTVHSSKKEADQKETAEPVEKKTNVTEEKL